MNETLISAAEAYAQVLKNKQDGEADRRAHLHKQMRMHLIRQINDAVTDGKLFILVYPSVLHKEQREELCHANYTITQDFGASIFTVSWEKK